MGGSRESPGKCCIGHRSQLRFLPLRPRAALGTRRGYSKQAALAAHGGQRPLQAAGRFLIRDFAQDRILTVGPDAPRGTRLRNAQDDAPPDNGHHGAFQPTRHLLVGQRAEQLVLPPGPAPEFGRRVADAQLLPLVRHGAVRAARVPHDFRVQGFAQPGDFLFRPGTAVGIESRRDVQPSAAVHDSALGTVQAAGDLVIRFGAQQSILLCRPEPNLGGKVRNAQVQASAPNGQDGASDAPGHIAVGLMTEKLFLLGGPTSGLGRPVITQPPVLVFDGAVAASGLLHHFFNGMVGEQFDFPPLPVSGGTEQPTLPALLHWTGLMSEHAGRFAPGLLIQILAGCPGECGCCVSF